MSVADYARATRAEGAKVYETSDGWWREIRPFFLRPLVPYLELPARKVAAPGRALLGGFQHVVPPGVPGNSTIGFLIFADAEQYTLEQLESQFRRQVRSAAKQFSIRPFADCAEFKEKAHPIYIEFYHRTRYDYMSQRLAKAAFDRWAETIFATPGLLVLGAFDGNQLGAVNISRVIDDTLHYASFFAGDEAMRRNVSSLMLHTVRMAAAASGDIRQVFAGMRKTGADQSIDAFYVFRGCSIQNKPAWLNLNPITGWFLRDFRPHVWNRLVGEKLG